MKFLMVILVSLFGVQSFAQALTVDCALAIKEVADTLDDRSLILNQAKRFMSESNQDANVQNWACAIESTQKAIDMIDKYVDLSNQVVTKLSVKCTGFDAIIGMVNTQVDQIAADRADQSSAKEHYKIESLRFDPTGIEVCR